MTDFTLQDVLIAFALTLMAGLATGVGGLLAAFTERTNTKVLSIALGFSAGVMIYVSFMEILPKSHESLAEELGENGGAWLMMITFFAGMLIIALIDKLVPSFENPHEIHRVEDLDPNAPRSTDPRLLRMGVMSALAIGIHNFPEGLATFMAALKDTSLGVSIATAIAIHNIPEGIAVAIPIFYATGSRKKAISLSFISGLAEPLGALLGFFVLLAFFSELVFGLVFGAVAGIMVFISFDELLPTAREYGEHHLSLYGLIAGMGVMALSLVLL